VQDISRLCPERRFTRIPTHICTFKIGVETNEITTEAVGREGSILRCRGGVEHKVEWDKSSGLRVIRERFCGETVGEGEERKVSTNPVRRVES
jgi:hypothetical protein